MEFQPQFAGFADRVRDSFDRQGVMGLLGARLGAIEPGYCAIRADFRDALSQQHDFFHGGVVATIGDSAGGYAAYTLMAADSSVLTVEYKVNFMAPAQGDALIAHGRVIRPGRTLFTTRVDVVVVAGHGREAVETPCAAMQQTIMCMAGRGDGSR